MAITRQLPKSNTQRQKALTTAKKRHDNLANPADNVLTANTLLRLTAIEALYKAAMLASGGKLAVQINVTDKVEEKKLEARMYVSHFFQSFNNGVDRKVFLPGDRAFYMLDANSSRVPELDKESDILLWGERIKTGDADRVAGGGAAMAMPAAAEVDGKVTAFDTANNEQSNKKLAFDQSQEAVDALNTEANAVIKKVWDEAETFYNEETAASKRRKCREWGVVYVSEIPNIIHLAVKNQADGTAVAGASILIVETDATFVTDANGKQDVKTNLVEGATLRISADNFITQDKIVEFIEGHEFTVEVLLVHV